MKAVRAIFTFCATIAVAIPLAAAQPAQKEGPGAMMGGQMSMMGMMGQGCMMPMMGMSDHVAGRLAFLKAELKITDAQLPQWNAFADALRAHATQMREMMQQMTSMMYGGTLAELAPEARFA